MAVRSTPSSSPSHSMLVFPEGPSTSPHPSHRLDALSGALDAAALGPAAPEALTQGRWAFLSVSETFSSILDDEEKRSNSGNMRDKLPCKSRSATEPGKLRWE